MEAIPARQPCQISSRQPILLLSFVHRKDSLARRAVSQLLFYLLAYTGKAQPDELSLALEGVNPGTKHNMKSKCGG